MVKSQVNKKEKFQKLCAELEIQCKNDLDSCLYQIYNEYKISASDIISTKRNRYLTVIRSAIYQFLLDKKYSKKLIGRVIGRNHATVIHGLWNFEFYSKHQVPVDNRKITISGELIYNLFKDSQIEKESLFI